MLSIRLVGLGQLTERTAALQSAITHVLNLYGIRAFPDGAWTVNLEMFNKLVERIVSRANETQPPGMALFVSGKVAPALIERGYKPGSLPLTREAAPAPATQTVTIPAQPRPAPIVDIAPQPTEAPARYPLPGSVMLPVIIPPSPEFPEVALPTPRKSNAWLWIGGILALYLLGRHETPHRSRSSSRSGQDAGRLSGLSGETANCLLWQEVEGKKTGGLLWRCLKYAPVCVGKSCKPETFKFQTRTCIKTKRVPSKSSKFKSSTLERCAKYSPVCTTSTCLPEPFEKPGASPGHGMNVKRMAIDVAKQMALDRNTDEEIGGKAFGREIMERGGIRPYRGRSRSGKRVKGGEEYAALPLFMRRKDGLPLDEMASEMGFDDDRALLEAIKSAYPKGRQVQRRWSTSDFISAAESQVWDAIDAGMIGGLGQELFPGLKRELVLKTEDIATSDDLLDIFLQRKGWDINRVRELQASISGKAVPDMFTGKTVPLSAGEVELQRHIEEYLETVRAQRAGSKKAAKAKKQVKRDPFWIEQPTQAMLLGLEGCRDKEGNFVPVPQCTGRRIPEKELKEKAPEDMTPQEAEAERSALNKKAIENLKKAAAISPGLQYDVPKAGRTLSHDIATHYLTRDEMTRYKLLTRAIAISYIDPETVKRILAQDD